MQSTHNTEAHNPSTQKTEPIHKTILKKIQSKIKPKENTKWTYQDTAQKASQKSRIPEKDPRHTSHVTTLEENKKSQTTNQHTQNK